MSADTTERRLAGVLYADVVGYSRLMAEDEDGAVRILTAYRAQIGALVGEHRGRVADFSGDSFLAEFPTALDAMRCAIETQRVLAARNAGLPAERRMEFRVGVHLGDIRVEGERLYGEGVNVAARLEKLSEPGGICISEAVREQIASKLTLDYEDLGEQSFKNVSKPVRVYRARTGDLARRESPSKPGRLRTLALIAGGIVLVVAAGIALTWPRPLGLLLDLAGVSAPPVNPPLPEKPSIVVLPFANMSGDPEQAYFADGFTEDVTTALSRNAALFVISRNSAFSYKGRPVKVEEVGRELGVRYVLEGSVRKVEDRLRITAQLIDTNSGFHLWSESYDRDLGDIFALQTELATEIQTTLRVAIRNAEMARARQPETHDVDAYDANMRGLFLFEQFRRSSNLEARRWFARAFELDPDFASAYAMYGITYSIEYNFGWNRDPELLALAEDAARKAIRLDDSTADAWNALAGVHAARQEFEEALEAAERGIAAEPSHDIPHLVRGVALAAMGRFVPALSSIEQALRLNPKGSASQRILIAFVNYRAGRTAQAVASFEEARAENLDLILPRLALIAHHDAEERGDTHALAEEILRTNPDMTAEEGAKMVISLGGFDALDAFRRAGLP